MVCMRLDQRTVLTFMEKSLEDIVDENLWELISYRKLDLRVPEFAGSLL